MKGIQKVELKLENYDKCSFIIDSDCPLGQLYDFSCVLKSFIIQKMKEEEESKKNCPEPESET
jgi:hypothetical protein